VTEIKTDRGAGAALATTTGDAPAKGTLASMLDKSRTSIEAALPRGFSPDRFVRIVHTELRKTPKLAQTTPGSFLGAVLTSAQLGLEIGSSLGQAYLVPFKNHGVDETQLIIGFRGWLALIHRGGQVASIDAREVHENDMFDYQYGDDSYLRHKPANGERGPVIAYYCVAKTKNGGRIFEVMTKAEVEKHRNRTKKNQQGDFTGPWATHFDEMALKTVFKKVFKWLPVSTEQQLASSVDEGIVLRTSVDEEPEVTYIDVDENGEIVENAA
jgi:recombination protein RecT